MAKIFISYARDGCSGESLSGKARQVLIKNNFEVFLDVETLEPGESFPHRLETELSNSNVMILIVSEKVRTSEWVYSEYNLAKSLLIPVIPILAEDVELPLWLRNVQVLNFNETENWQKLLSSISKKLNEYIPSEDTITRDQNLIRPTWASKAGFDQYGSYADLYIKGVVQRFRWIDKGRFMMGSPENEDDREDGETLHEVSIIKGFWLADTVCTQELWVAIMGTNPSYFNKNEKNPVENVSWDQIQDFFLHLNQLSKSLNACLPTEAQWEYACRAGTNTPYYFGEDVSPQYANYLSDTPLGETVVVKSYLPNPWGLYEMHGNVVEFCHDYWIHKLPKKYMINPIGFGFINSLGYGIRVSRGGSWLSSNSHIRSAKRWGFSQKFSDNGFGFRICISHENANLDDLARNKYIVSLLRMDKFM